MIFIIVLFELKDIAVQFVCLFVSIIHQTNPASGGACGWLSKRNHHGYLIFRAGGYLGMFMNIISSFQLAVQLLGMLIVVA